MFIKTLSISGYRGFSKKQSLNLAIPNGKEGSGLTILVGPNNSGKSSIIESIRIITSQQQIPTFSDSKRNKQAGDRIKIGATVEDGRTLYIATVSQGGSNCIYDESEIQKHNLKAFVLPSRRNFQAFFSGGASSRDNIVNGDYFKNQRGQDYNNIFGRIFQIHSLPDEFDKVLKRVLGQAIEWTIDQSDQGQYFMKFHYNGNFHNSDGAGEGLLSVFTIVDSLYDSKSGDTIVIDEPELSLHPALQKKVLELLLEFSQSRQIVISTHSPFFISWNSLINGGKLARVVKENDGIKINHIDTDASKILSSLLANFNNPHILGLDAKEVFFLDDEINIVEGQEDVIFYKKILQHLNIDLTGTFFGWGTGGSSNLSNILMLFKSLGFRKINCILDHNMIDLKNTLSAKYSDYNFITIPTDDVRDKNEVKQRDAIKGLIDSGGKNVKQEYVEPLKEIFQQINKYFQN